MGNCMMKRSRSRQQVEEEEIEEIREAGEKENEGKKGSIKVKIMLTKEELDLFLQKLKNNNSTGNGGKSLAELLGEMEKARSIKVQSSWRPSLESITEHDDDVMIDS
ncbi:hypothetical protein like AT4G23870 [Hibiscus trionum]|uniref:Uncharacterized protein n=1 Tax=Hibiscus trionum TaxID=183268 RepID=A0A9W7IQK5_HIBTR|nr:hypothetical protein like AT4G23870 [Hibiscus trionum]